MVYLVKLGEVCLVKRGTTITKKQTLEGNIPVIGGGTKPTYFHNQSNRDSNCITISGSGASAGFVNTWDEPIFASDCSTVEPKDETQLNKFIYYFLLSRQKFIFENFRSGAAQPHVYAKDIATLDYPIIPIAEQKLIVSKIDAAFSEIDKLHLLMQSRKIEIESLRSNLLTYFINNQGTGERTKLKNVVSYIRKNAINSGLPYVGLENIQSNTMDLIGDISIPDKTSSTFEFNENYVLYGRLRPYLKKVAVPEFKGQCSTEIFCLKPNKNLLKKFLAFWLIESSIAKRIELSSTGARMPRANMNQILDFEINIPPIDEQIQIVDKLEKTFKLTKKLNSIHIALEENLQSLKSKFLEEELASLI